MKILICVLTLMQMTLYGRIYDNFTFFNELELLKVRFEELYDCVDHFVIVEGTKTFGGDDKPLYFQEHAHEFEKYKDKIIHVVIDDFPEPTGDIENDNWARQIYSRNCQLRGLRNCEANDIILISDVDEIPNKQSIEKIKNYFAKHNSLRAVGGRENQLICELHMRLYRFQLNREDPIAWLGGVKAAPYWLVKKRSPWTLKILHMYDRKLPKIYDAGWHFSAMGGKNRVLYRWKNHGAMCMLQDLLKNLDSDQKFLEEYITKEMSQFSPVPIDETFPKSIRDNLDFFYSIGWIAEED